MEAIKNTSKTYSFSDLNEQEWLVSNGIGGYASSTICGLNTRKYHGLLIASKTPPTHRNVLVSKLEETVIMGNERIRLNTNQYPGHISPTGYKYLHSFTPAPFPSALFKVKKLELSKTIWMHYGHNTTVIEYKNEGNENINFTVRPHFVSRNHHHLQESVTDQFSFHNDINNIISVTSNSNQQTVYVNAEKSPFSPDYIEYHNNEYLRELDRGQAFKEPTVSFGSFQISLEPKKSTFILLSTEKGETTLDGKTLKQEELKRLKNLVPKNIKNPFTSDLICAFDKFIVKRASSNSETIIAGYPWFTDWGRDTMIAMRGTILPLKRYDIFKSIITTFYNNIEQGLLPNRFPDEDDEPEYNTVDGTLWSFVVLYEYYTQTQDKKFIEGIFHKLTDILDWHFKGTYYNIHVNNQGYLEAGTPKTQLTWMDAKVGDHVETPRNGCPVEINALWYNALQITNYFAIELKQKVNPTYSENADFIASNFLKDFLHPSNTYLFDVINKDEKDKAIRPNQAFVLNLPFKLVPKDFSQKILKTIEEELLTPYGLRTLNTDHKQFRPQYSGDQWHRDTAYHQGTVWPFLLSDFFHAYIENSNNHDEACKAVTKWLKPLKEHFYTKDCLMGISEIFDGLTPNKGKGCIHQAWSVSGPLGVILKHNLKV